MRHVRNSHPVPQRKFQCGECLKQYNSKDFFRNHQKKEHNITYVREHELYYCPNCEYKDFRRSKLIDHFKVVHKIKIEETEYLFETFEEFSIWKEKIENDTNSRFVKKGGCDSKRRTKFFYYACHRSGYFTLKAQRKRHLKTQGSNKINGLCPASISVKITKNGNFLEAKFLHSFWT